MRHLSERLRNALHESFSLPRGLSPVRGEQFCTCQTHPWSIRSSQFGKLNFRICNGKSKMNQDSPGNDQLWAREYDLQSPCKQPELLCCPLSCSQSVFCFGRSCCCVWTGKC